MDKVLNVTSSADLTDDIEICGDPDFWQLLCKASSKAQGWMKSTKILDIPFYGCVLQVTTQQGHHVAEALVALPGVHLVNGELVGKL